MNSKKIKIVAATAVLLMLAAIFTPNASAVANEKNKKMELQEKAISSQFENIINSNMVVGKSYTPRAMLANPSEYYSPMIISYDRIGIVHNDIAEYSITLKVGPGNFDKIAINGFVKEKIPYHSTATKALDMSLGQSLTPILYREKAIQTAENCDCAVYMIGRREDNIKTDSGLTELQVNEVMRNWSNDKYLLDMYYGIIVSKIQTAFLARENPESIEVIVWGHSLGAKNWDDYDKLDYDKMPFGNITYDIQVDMIMGYDPFYQDLIETQRNSFDIVNQTMNSGKYYNNEGATMIYITSLAANPQTANERSVLPGLTDYTNIQVFRMMNFATWQFGNALAPNFHYLDGNINELYDVNEQEMMAKILNGGVVPYTPLFENLIISGQLGKVPKFQTGILKTDADLTSISFKGGMDYFAEYIPRQTGEIKSSLVVTTEWNNAGGHAAIIFAKNNKVDKFWRDISELVKET